MTNRIANEAAEWVVRLSDRSGDDLASLRQQFEQWKKADPRHAAAAARIEGLISRMEGLRRTPGGASAAHAALDASTVRTEKRTRRRRAVIAAALLVLGVAAGRLAWKEYPPDYLMADVRSGAGEWIEHTLPDASRITLAGNSAINVRFDERGRSVELVRGEILVDVVRDAVRPFTVETAHGSIRALGTRFVVSRGADATLLAMLQSRSAAKGVRQGAVETTVVDAGQRVRITEDAVVAAGEVDVRSVSDAWKFRQLVVNDRPLPEVLDELARHRRGLIRFDREALAHLRVSAVLPLDDTDRSLRLLAESFPIVVRTPVSWLVVVDSGAPRQPPP